MTLESVIGYLRSPASRPEGPSAEMVLSEIKREKEVVARSGNDSEAKRYWCLEEALTLQTKYIEAFAALKRQAYYDAWCLLEQVEIGLRTLEKHENEHWSAFLLDFLSEYVEKWQGLFPYKVFFSPEFLELEKCCSICGSRVTPRTGCRHKLGQVYGGDLCVYIVEKMDVLGIALVANPVQKYSVPFLDDGNGKKKDHYNYALVEYANNAIAGPFDRWWVEEEVRRQPHSRFTHVGRNDPCPCDSKIKYKRCCLLHEGVLRPHFQFRWERPPANSIPSEAFI